MTTQRLLLTPASDHDLFLLYTHWSRTEIQPQMFLGRALDVYDAERLLDNATRCARGDGGGLWKLRLRQHPGFVGVVGLLRIDERASLEVVFSLEAAHRGHGYATEALLAVMAYGFEGLGLDAMYCSADLPNVPALRVLERLGFLPIDGLAGSPERPLARYCAFSAFWR